MTIPWYRRLSELPGWSERSGRGCSPSAPSARSRSSSSPCCSRRNLRLAVTLVVVGAIAGAIAFAVAEIVDLDAIREAAGVDDGSLSAESVVWLAVATAVLLTVAPYLVRPARRFVHGCSSSPCSVRCSRRSRPCASILARSGSGGGSPPLVSLVIGTPKATPTLHSVVQRPGGARDLDRSARPRDLQTWGETRFVGRAPDGAPAIVVVIGRDGADARLVSKLWRSLLYRDAGPSIAVTRSAQLEHRAYMLLMAAKAGVPVSEVVIAASGGRAGHRAARPARPRRAAALGRSTPTTSPMTPRSTTRGTNLVRLHDARLTPRSARCRRTSSSLADGSTAFVDFSQGSAGAARGAVPARSGRPARHHRRARRRRACARRRDACRSGPTGSRPSCR